MGRKRQLRRVRLYGKPGCHLCDDARGLLDRIGRNVPMEIEEVDITLDPALFRRYDIRIPVVLIDGSIELEAPLEERVLRKALT